MNGCKGEGKNPELQVTDHGFYISLHADNPAELGGVEKYLCLKILSILAKSTTN